MYNRYDYYFIMFWSILTVTVAELSKQSHLIWLSLCTGTPQSAFFNRPDKSTLAGSFRILSGNSESSIKYVYIFYSRFLAHYFFRQLASSSIFCQKQFRILVRKNAAFELLFQEIQYEKRQISKTKNVLVKKLLPQTCSMEKNKIFYTKILSFSFVLFQDPDK